MKTLKRIDRDALQRALRMARTRNPDRFPPGRGNLDDATSATYSCQMDSLHLKPWQPLPCWAEEDRPRDEHPIQGRVAAWLLARRLVKMGLSIYEPDPVAALEAAAARQRRDQLPGEDQRASMPS